MKKIAITTTTFGEYDARPVGLLADSDFYVLKNELGRTMAKNEICSLCAGCVGIIAGTENYDHDLLKTLKGLKVISRVGVGLDSIDIKAADELGIRVVTTPYGPVNAVAELAIGLILNLLRKVSCADRNIRTGVWKKNMGNLLRGKRVGIIGYGRIGKRVAELLTAFGCDIACYDLIPSKGAIRSMPLEDLLGWADIVTIHVSGKEEVIGKNELKRMKKGSWLVNASRGGTVDEDALYSVLKDKHLSGAAVDVFTEEPYKGALKELDNVILTPHIASYAIESRIEMEMDAVKNLIKTLSEVGR